MEKRRIIFDLNGTLFEALDYETRLKILLKEGGIDYSDYNIHRMLNAMKSYEYYHDRYTYEDYTRHLREASELPIDEKFIKYFLSRADVLAPDKIDENVLDVLDYLVLRYNLVVLTNYFAYAQYDQMAYKHIAHYFSEVYGGEEVLKPKKEAFLMACGDYNESECVMIGDDPIKDIRGALNVPMDAIYYHKTGIINTPTEINDIRYLKKIL